MATLNGSNTRVDVGGGVTVRAPGYRGEITRVPLASGGTRAPAGTATKQPLAAALAAAEVQTTHTLTIDLRPVSGPRPAGTRALGGADAMVVNAPQAGLGQGQAALLVDPSGVVTWHYPQADPAAAGRVQFVVPVEATSPVVETPAGQRGLVGAVVHQLLSIVVFPIAEEIVGAAAERVAAYWEGKNRPYRVRTFTPDDYQVLEVGTADTVDWSHLSSGPALLLIHGTFSTSRGGFGGLPPEVLGRLNQAYGKRLLAVDHPTLSVTPEQNVAELLARTPAGVRLQVDVLCHSRGGLVARALDAVGGQTYQVRRIVFVAVPNKGTVLADPKRLGTLVNRYTTMLNLIPDGPWSVATDVLQGVLTAVKVLGQGALGGLPGLQVMDPSNAWLTALGAGASHTPEYYGIAADFEPSCGLKLLARAVDMVVDDAFSRVLNDLVVPTEGVAHPRDADGFPFPADRTLRLDKTANVWHSSYFSNPLVTKALLNWLTG
jgi:hypothetical protein